MDILISKKEIRLNELYVPNTLTLKDITQMIARDKYYSYYQTVKAKNKMIEDDIHHGVPMMNQIFYSRFAYCRNMSYQFFLNEYKRMHCVRLPDGKMTFKSKEPRYQYIFYEKELDGKLLRAYMSFLKELFVLYSLIEMGCDVQYDSKDDTKNGFDLTLYNQYGHHYGIRIFADTDKAKKFAEIKERVRHNYTYTSIAMQAKMAKCIIGDTYVFTQDQMKALHNHILSNSNENLIL